MSGNKAQRALERVSSRHFGYHDVETVITHSGTPYEKSCCGSHEQWKSMKTGVKVTTPRNIDRYPPKTAASIVNQLKAAGFIIMLIMAVALVAAVV